MRGFAGLRTRIGRLERRVNVERIGCAWLNPDKSVVFDGKVFTDQAEFEEAWRVKGYDSMYLVTWNLDIPCSQQVFRGAEALQPIGAEGAGAEEGGLRKEE
jgi:hypothetical protein